jgi:taurine dioxygenase
MSGLRIRRLGYALGAEITGLDLRSHLQNETIAAIRQAWLDNLLLCFPNQDLSQDELLSFGLRFGELERASKVRASKESPHINVLAEKTIDGKPWNGYKSGAYWHSDRDYTTRPTEGTFLNCKETPPVGGDTLFANTYTAYSSLSPAMRGIVDRLSAVHAHSNVIDTFQRVSNAADRERMLQAVDDEAREHLPTVHPAARTHPETGRKALYLGDRVKGFVGLSDDEGRPLLDFLNRHSLRYEFTYRHRWTVGDLVMWDNRCTYHMALCDYRLGHDVRFMMRCATMVPVEEGRALARDEQLAVAPA